MKFNTEKDSIDYVCNYFEKKGFKATPTQSDNQYCHYDITLTKNDKTIWLELKRRNFTSDKYGDVVIEKNKYDYFIQSKSNNLVNGVIIVTLFEDCFTLSNALSPVGFFQRKGAHHTEFWDKTIITHNFVKYNQDLKINYEKIPQQED